MVDRLAAVRRFHLPPSGHPPRRAARSNISRISSEALAEPTAGEWRIHFHVPLFTAEYDGLGSTQDDVRTRARGGSRDTLSLVISRSRPTRGTCCPAAEDRPARVDRARVRLGARELAVSPATMQRPSSSTSSVSRRRCCARMPSLARWTSARRSARIKPAFPAVTCTAQADYLTGTYPERHGIVGNGWYSREDCEVRFWKQANPLVQAPKIWDAARAERSVVHRARTCSGGSTCTRRRTTRSRRGRCIRPTAAKLPDVYTNPGTLRDELQSALGTFPLFEFWGPRTSIRSLAVDCRGASKLVEQKYNPTLTLIYLPHLDYNLQRLGVSSAAHRRGPCRRSSGSPCDLIAYYEARGARVIVLSEYGLARRVDARAPQSRAP